MYGYYVDHAQQNQDHGGAHEDGGPTVGIGLGIFAGEASQYEDYAAIEGYEVRDTHKEYAMLTARKFRGFGPLMGLKRQ